MKKLNLAIASAMLLLTAPVHGHFIWMTLDPHSQTVRVELADSPGKEVAPILYTLRDHLVLNGIHSLVDAKDHLSMRGSVSSKDRPVGLSVRYGVFQEMLVHWSAKAASGDLQAKTPMKLDAEILVSTLGDHQVAKIMFHGRPVAGAAVEVYSDGKPIEQGKSDRDGIITFRARTGLVQIGAMIQEQVSGTYQGKKYRQKVEACSLVYQMS